MAKMHSDEFDIDETLVRKLIAEQFPHWASLSLVPVLSSGTDNALYRLGKDKVVRLPKVARAIENLKRELLLLPMTAPFLPLAVPVPIGKGAPTKEYPGPWAIYHWIEGCNPIAGQFPEAAIPGLVRFLQNLWRIEIPGGPPSCRGGPLKERDVDTRRAIGQLQGEIDVRTVTALWDKALRATDRSDPPVWIHGDLSPGNLLILEEKLVAVIDFGMVGKGDPACDLCVAWNVLSADRRELFRRSLGPDEDTWERGKGWGLSVALIQLPYYKKTNPSLAANARRVIRELTQEG